MLKKLILLIKTKQSQKIKIPNKHRIGGVFILILFILMGLTVLGMTVLTTSFYGLKMERQNYEREEDFAYIEAGIHRYQFFLNLNEDYYENLEKIEGELNYDIDNNIKNIETKYPINDDKNIFIKDIQKEADGTFTYTPNYYPYENGYYKVEIDKTQTQSEKNNGLLEGDRQQLTILTTYYEEDATGNVTIPVRIENTEISKICRIKRKIETRFARKQFTETAYLSDVEGSIWWGTGESFDGAFHTNSDIHILGTPHFNGLVTYSGKVIEKVNNNDREIVNPGTTLSNVFLGGIMKVPTIEFPNTVEAIKIIVQPEHKYQGIIGIIFDKNKPGQYYIKRRIAKRVAGYYNYYVSDWSEKIGPIDLPTNGLIYVSNVTANRSNYDIANTISVYNNTTSYNYFKKKWGLYNNSITGVNDGDILTAGQQANVFIEGELSGGVTIVSENNIYITGDLTYSNPQKDILGLISNYDVLINHFESKYNRTHHTIIPATFAQNEIKINAAIYAGRKFGFELYRDSRDYNRKGFIKLNGSLINRERGYVGIIGQAGFDKNYSYDDRLQSMTPPHFIQPINAPWEIKYERERN